MGTAPTRLDGGVYGKASQPVPFVRENACVAVSCFPQRLDLAMGGR